MNDRLKNIATAAACVVAVFILAVLWGYISMTPPNPVVSIEDKTSQAEQYILNEGADVLTLATGQWQMDMSEHNTDTLLRILQEYVSIYAGFCSPQRASRPVEACAAATKAVDNAVARLREQYPQQE